MQEHLQNVRKILDEQSLDALLLSSIPNIFYLTNYNGFIPDERDGYVLITKDQGYILTNLLYSEAMPTAVPHLQLIEITRDNPLKKSLDLLVKKNNIKTLGFEGSNLTFLEYKQIESLPIVTKPADLTLLRTYKDAAELNSLKKACALTDKGFTYIQKLLKPGVSEEEISRKMHLYFLEHGADSAFRAVVAFGKNTSVPHHLSGDTKLKKNDVVLIDYGAKVDNYCADVTRTFFIGKATKKQKEIYELVYATQIYAQELMKVKLSKNEEITSYEIDKAAREYIAERNYPPFPYSLGHGIGLEVHELPYLNPSHHELMDNNIVFTLEPGIHLNGEIGVRIEDMFMIKDNTLEQLTHSPNTLLEL